MEEDLRCLMSCVRTLVCKDGNVDKLCSDVQRARYESLKARPLHQLLYSNVVAARTEGHNAGLSIKLLEDDGVRALKVEDVFMELSFDILPKIVACLSILHQNCEKKSDGVSGGSGDGSDGNSSSTSSVSQSSAIVAVPCDKLWEDDSNALRCLLQFIVTLGIHPFLSLRLRENAEQYTSEDGGGGGEGGGRGRHPTTNLEARQTMMTIVGYLRCLREHHELLTLLRGDVVHCSALCVLIEQVVFDATQHVTSEGELDLCAVMKKQARIWLDELVDSFQHPDLIAQLLYLQHLATLPSRSFDLFVAGQFQDECEKLILRFAMRPDGLVHVLDAVMRTRRDWNFGPELTMLFKQLSHMLTRATLQGLPASEYYNSIVKQLVDLVNEETRNHHNILINYAAVAVLRRLSHTDAAHNAFKDQLYAPLSVLYDGEKANALPVLSNTFLGDVIVEKAEIERTIRVIHEVMTGQALKSCLNFRVSSVLPVISLFFMGATMPVRSKLRRRVLEILKEYFLQHLDPVSQMFVLLDGPEPLLLRNTAYISTAGHMVRSQEGDDQEFPWRNDTRDLWPPTSSLLSPSFVHVMDLMLERAKEPNSPIIAGSSAKHENDGSLAADVRWNRNCLGAKVVSAVLAQCLTDLTRSLSGQLEGSTVMLEPGSDAEPAHVANIGGDFVRLSLVATATERYGPDILPRTAEAMVFAAQGLASAAFCLDARGTNAVLLDKALEARGKGRIVAYFHCWVINAYPAVIWSLVSVQLCLALLSHLLESEDKVLNPETIRKLMFALRVIGNCHPEEHIRQHCLEVQIAVSTYTTTSSIGKTESSGAGEITSATELEQILISFQEQGTEAVSALGPEKHDVHNASDGTHHSASSRSAADHVTASSQSASSSDTTTTAFTAVTGAGPGATGQSGSQTNSSLSSSHLPPSSESSGTSLGSSSTATTTTAHRPPSIGKPLSKHAGARKASSRRAGKATAKYTAARKAGVATDEPRTGATATDAAAFSAGKATDKAVGVDAEPAAAGTEGGDSSAIAVSAQAATFSQAMMDAHTAVGKAVAKAWLGLADSATTTTTTTTTGTDGGNSEISTAPAGISPSSGSTGGSSVGLDADATGVSAATITGSLSPGLQRKRKKMVDDCVLPADTTTSQSTTTTTTPAVAATATAAAMATEATPSTPTAEEVARTVDTGATITATKATATAKTTTIATATSATETTIATTDALATPSAPTTAPTAATATPTAATATPTVATTAPTAATTAPTAATTAPTAATATTTAPTAATATTTAPTAATTAPTAATTAPTAATTAPTAGTAIITAGTLDKSTDLTQQTQTGKEGQEQVMADKEAAHLKTTAASASSGDSQPLGGKPSVEADASRATPPLTTADIKSASCAVGSRSQPDSTSTLAAVTPTTTATTQGQVDTLQSVTTTARQAESKPAAIGQPSSAKTSSKRASTAKRVNIGKISGTFATLPMQHIKKVAARKSEAASEYFPTSTSAPVVGGGRSVHVLPAVSSPSKTVAGVTAVTTLPSSGGVTTANSISTSSTTSTTTSSTSSSSGSLPGESSASSGASSIGIGTGSGSSSKATSPASAIGTTTTSATTTTTTTTRSSSSSRREPTSSSSSVSTMISSNDSHTRSVPISSVPVSDSSDTTGISARGKSSSSSSSSSAPAAAGAAATEAPMAVVSSAPLTSSWAPATTSKVTTATATIAVETSSSSSTAAQPTAAPPTTTQPTTVQPTASPPTAAQSTAMQAAVSPSLATTTPSVRAGTATVATAADDQSTTAAAAPAPAIILHDPATGKQYNTIVEYLELDKLNETLERLPGEMVAETMHIKREVEQFSAAVDAAMSEAMEEALIKLNEVSVNDSPELHSAFSGRLAALVDNITEHGELLAARVADGPAERRMASAAAVDSTAVPSSGAASAGAEHAAVANTDGGVTTTTTTAEKASASSAASPAHASKAGSATSPTGARTLTGASNAAPSADRTSSGGAKATVGKAAATTAVPTATTTAPTPASVAAIGRASSGGTKTTGGKAAPVGSGGSKMVASAKKKKSKGGATS